MEVPKLANTKGIFEIFIPGTFLLLNFLGIFVVLFYPTFKTLFDSCNFPTNFLFNPLFGTVFIICFGYLAGIVLRFMRPEIPEYWSQKYNLKFSKKVKENDSTLLNSNFPYLEWFNYLFQNNQYPSKYTAHFIKIWAEGLNVKHKKQFFNFYKLLICFNDKEATDEIYSAESISRYNVGIFYALVISIISLLTALVIVSLSALTPYKFVSLTILPEFTFLLLILIVIYSLSLIIVIRNFRLIRMKEVETVIVASVKNYNKIQLPETNDICKHNL